MSRKKSQRLRLFERGNKVCPLCLREFSEDEVEAGRTVTREHALAQRALGGILSSDLLDLQLVQQCREQRREPCWPVREVRSEGRHVYSARWTPQCSQGAAWRVGFTVGLDGAGPQGSRWL